MPKEKIRNIPIIEDFAHSFDSELNGHLIGSLGDYTIYSLPKILPVELGGILLCQKKLNIPHFTPSLIDKIIHEFYSFSPYLSFFSQRRKDNFKALQEFLKGKRLLFSFESQLTPFFFGVFLENALKIRELNHSIQWGSTLQDDLLLIPTNPMVPSQVFIDTLKEVKDLYA